MENNKFNKKIISNVKSRIVISNLEREETMKLNKKKQILSLVAVIAVILTGSFCAVNAATDGELVEKVKDKVEDTVKIKFVQEDGKEKELEGTVYKNSENQVIVRFEWNTNNAEYEIDTYKSNLDDKNMTINGTVSDNEVEMTIEGEK